MKPRIAVTLGDPAGIGPDIVAKALRDPRVRRVCDPIVLGKNRPGKQVRMGHASREAGLQAIDALAQALELTRNGQVRAIVTAPVSKEAFRLAHHGFPGHTEWLAHVCRVKEAAMLMVAGPMRAILMTRHVPLAQVSRHLTSDVIQESARLGFQFVKRHVLPHPPYGHPLPKGRGQDKTCLLPSGEKVAGGRMRAPRLVLCGLNPHAGDHGLIGQEEQRIFLPALRALMKQGIDIAGPLPADTVFSHMAQGHYDLALAAYHDQGMIPLKLFAPHRIVNVTLGLPFIRTSPGHGTAYDIAGKGRADARPMVEAILLAAQFIRRDAL